MIRRNASRWLAAATLATVSTGIGLPAAAQDVPKGRTIHIHMAGSRTNPEGSNPYRISKVLPNSKGLCRGAAQQKDDCHEEVAWVLKGTDLPAGWYVEVRQKADAPKECFSASTFTLSDGDPVESGAVNDKVCSKYDVWPYDVVLLKNATTEKGREDPLVVINY